MHINFTLKGAPMHANNIGLMGSHSQSTKLCSCFLTFLFLFAHALGRYEGDSITTLHSQIIKKVRMTTIIGVMNPRINDYAYFHPTMFPLVLVMLVLGLHKGHIMSYSNSNFWSPKMVWLWFNKYIWHYCKHQYYGSLVGIVEKSMLSSNQFVPTYTTSEQGCMFGFKIFVTSWDFVIFISFLWQSIHTTFYD